MILSFNKRFVDQILSGKKIHTIREDPHTRWKAGRKIHMATGVRTKNYHCFDDTKTCVSVQSLQINHYESDFPAIEVIIDGVLKFKQMSIIWNGSDFIDLLAKNDGFDSADAFFKWFDRDFHGRIIHWTDFRY